MYTPGLLSQQILYLKHTQRFFAISTKKLNRPFLPFALIISICQSDYAWWP
ncbi:hypothetical protein AG1IA_08767 [Rhizoctonia solani AG-1 IA]|uniref:Uncharacterized protein n=1 Tax=Thanatephorus cucumeris (strain AG1-IA) TaxID=983506 RepID=L8WLJ5_THACA|nr:hypothetical protein AG1IA_08767 [Rhizoctonia solani AG-1 IA]